MKAIVQVIVGAVIGIVLAALFLCAVIEFSEWMVERI